MKNIILFLFVLFSACKPVKNLPLEKTIAQKAVYCPQNGNCTIELIPNKSLHFKKDGIGILYPVITKGEKTILKYTYTRNSIPNTQDGSYVEIIYAELDPNITELSLTSKTLQQAKLYFGRFCYCKGATGFYPINNGIFKIKKEAKNNFSIHLDFKITAVPQVVTSFHEKFSLKSN